MRFEYRNLVTCADVGRRVTVRARTPDGATTDTVGTLEKCDERTFLIRNKRGALVEVERALIVASKTIEPR